MKSVGHKERLKTCSLELQTLGRSLCGAGNRNPCSEGMWGWAGLGSGLQRHSPFSPTGKDNKLCQVVNQ